MWPFSGKKDAEASLPNPKLEALIDTIAEKWLAFSHIPFNAEVPLEHRVQLFIEPALEGLLEARPEIGFLPTEVVMLIFANGILQAGTHSALEIQDALGIPRAE